VHDRAPIRGARRTGGNGPAATISEAASPPGVVRACRDDDVAVTVTYQPIRADGRMRGLVGLANLADLPCQVRGHATISLVNPADEAVDVPTRNTDQPGPPVPVILRPGGAAFAGINWVSCDKEAATCGVGNTLRISLGPATDGPAATVDGSRHLSRAASR
jgi:hypothetical protein